LLIECSRCRAVFSLQDGIAAAGTRFKVQCGRCLAVFEAAGPPRPPAAPGTAPESPDDAPAPTPAATASPGAADVVQLPPAPAPAPLPTPEDAQPAAAAPPSALRAAWSRTPTRARIALGVLGAAIVGVALYALTSPGGTEERVRQGREKLLLDDARSLREATSLFTDAAREAPGQAEPEAERAFALLLQASAHKDLASRVPPGQREEEVRAAYRLLQQGAAAARQAMADDAESLPAIRAMALADALSGSPEPAGARAEQAERLAPNDAWVLYVKAAAAAASGARDRAVQALSAARQAQPKLLRADVDLAAIAMDGGDRSGARELLLKVIRDNPRHDRARRMLAVLTP